MTNNILNIIENARNWIRTLAVSVSSFRSHFSQIAALAAFLLFIGAGNAWGTCYVLTEQTTKSKTWHGETIHQHTWSDENAAGIVKFEISCDLAGIDMGYKVQQLLNGEWVDASDTRTDFAYSWAWKTQTLDRAAKGVRFWCKGSVYTYVRNVSVTRASYLDTDVDVVRISKTADNNNIYPSNGVGVGSLVVEYSMDEGGDLRLSVDNPKFTLSRSTISGMDCETDTAHVHIEYRSSDVRAGGDAGTLTIQNDNYSKEVILLGTTIKHDQIGNWKDNVEVQTVGNWIFNAFTSTLSSANGVTYTTSDDKVIEVHGDTLMAVATGSATILAVVAGDGSYNPIDTTITITVTDKIAQYIVWERDYQNLHVGGANVALDAVASSDSTECATNGSRSIVYSIKSGSNTVVEVVPGNQLKINGIGQDTIVATQAGGMDADGHYYAAVSMEKPVAVRYNEDFGISYVYNFNDSTHLRTDDANNVRSEYVGSTRETILFEGKSSKSRETCTFENYPCKATWYFKRDSKGTGTLLVEQFIPGTGWVAAKSITSFSTDWATDTVTLRRDATKARIGIDQTKANLYFGGFKVEVARFIELEENGEVKDRLVYDAHIGAPQPKNLRVKYSDIHSILTLSLSEGAPFSLSTTEILDTRGRTDSVDITLTYKPTKIETNEEYTLTLSDGATTIVVTLDATSGSEVSILTSSDDWSEGNWNVMPTSTREAIIDNNVEVVVDKKVEVYKLTLRSGAKVTVAPNGGLTVGAGGIEGATSGDNLILAADNTGKTGFLRISPEYTGAMPKAKIELFSIAYTDNEARVSSWQYMGIPVAENDVIGWDFCEYGRQFIYGWDETKSTWFDCYGERIEQFKGYCLTQNDDSRGKLFTFVGTLIAPTSQPVTLTYTSDSPESGRGCHVLANSFAAPIDISKLSVEDFGGATATVYLFNTGSLDDIADETTTPGQYIAVAPRTASTLHRVDGSFPVVIPSMQGFYVRTEKTEGPSATLTLNYQKLVWNADYDEHSNIPLRIKGSSIKESNNTDENTLEGGMKVTVSDGKSADNLYLLASEDYDKSYENGYDAPKMMSDDEDIPNVFAVEEGELFAIDATSDLDGTFIGVRTGKASNYTMSFSHISGEKEWMFLDIETNQKTLISDGTSYTFSATPNSLITDRFLIIESEENSGVTTEIDNTEDEAKVHKFIKDNQLFILKNGVLYDGMGRRIQ